MPTYIKLDSRVPSMLIHSIWSLSRDHTRPKGFKFASFMIYAFMLIHSICLCTCVLYLCFRFVILYPFGYALTRETWAGPNSRSLRTLKDRTCRYDECPFSLSFCDECPFSLSFCDECPFSLSFCDECPFTCVLYICF
jgi:hypothetical protein